MASYQYLDPDMFVGNTFSGNLVYVRTALQNGIDVNCKESQLGATALHIASQNGRVDIVNLLLGWKANVNAKAEGGFTPLHRAVHKHQVDVVRLLLQHGADPTIQSI